ncbi:MurR/RpiR family transcriptional regulator [Carnobacterium maltaromaticum]|jgi:DNA-binding MurR/RpiR family transcriptional regulator|uniref:MurR/RpiR family transcriptional regulator n=1 Tax=Carnobacterium maltaromaticum TaxID=2751 RepID=UPI001C4DE0BF|nr:MurR/RpiR family transcriptional regulator [Carnobacterium maltaromaticum]MCI1819355.1 MurR/RpiR family transcriptional regulator [Carnobacterium maltaromaticum]
MLFLDKTPDLTSLDLTLYKYISEHSEAVTKMKIRELAEATHTSTTSILRFCKQFECTGFSEFRIKLQLYLKEQKQLKTSSKISDETSYIDFLQRTTEPFYQSKIKEAVDLLKDKELILFIGEGSSNVMALYGALYFSSIFNMALHIEDPTNHPVDFLSFSLSDKVCIVALSVNGETPEIIHYISHLNFSKSSVLSITNSSKSTVAQLSDVNIPYYITREVKNTADITSQLPALYTIEYLAKAVGNQLKKD